MDIVGISGLILSVLLLVAYVVYCYKNSVSGNLSQGLVLFISMEGAVAGVRVFLFALNKDVIALLKEQDLDASLVALGGIAIVWVSIVTIRDTFVNIRKTLSKP